MCRTARRLTAAFLLLAAGCAVDNKSEDTATAPGGPGGPQLGPAAVPNPYCAPVTSDEIEAALNALFVKNAWPDANSTLGKFGAIQNQLTAGDIDGARIKTRDLVRFIQNKFGNLTPTQQAAAQADLDSLVTDLFCYVGLSGQVFDLNPGDPPKAFDLPGLGGVQFPANIVPTGTLVTLTDISTGPSPLITNLDTYPGYISISLYPNTVLAQDAVVVICSNPPAPASVIIGHQDPTTGFELLVPTAVPSLLQSTCPGSSSMKAGPDGWLDRVMAQMARALTPTPLQAAPMMFLGGVGGLTRKFSPFGLVSPTLTAVGGVGGATSKFAPAAGPSLNPQLPSSYVQGPVGTSATTGLPFATVATPGGDADGSNLFPGVTVTFSTSAATTFDPDSQAKVCRVIGGVVTIQDTVQVQTDANGVATLPCLSFGNSSGFANLEASFDPTSLSFPNSNLVTITAVDGASTGSTLNWLVKSNAGQPTQLGLVTAPSSSAQAGVPFAQQPAVQLQDAFGNAAPTSGTELTATVTAGGGTATYTAPVTTDVNGLATFTDLAIGGSVAGTPQTLTFSFGGATSGASITIQLTPGPAAKLVMVTQPSTPEQAGMAFATQPTVSITDQYGNQVDTGLTVVASLASGGPALAGTTSVAAVAGVATFTDLRIDGTTGDRTIGFGSGGLAGTTSTTVTIGAGPAAQLAITTQPSTSAAAGVAFGTQPVVSIRDQFGNLVNSAANVTASLASGAGSLAGTMTVAASGGVASFTDLRIAGATGDRTLQFGSGALTSPASTTVSISAGAATSIMTYLNGTAAQSYDYGTALTAYANVAPSPQVLVTDAWNNPVGNQTIYWNATTSNGGILTVGSTGTPTAANGVAQVTSWTIGEGLNQASASLFAPGVTPTLPNYLDAAFTASTPTGQSVFACAVGTATNKTDVAPMSIKTPNASIRTVTLYMSVTGQSSALSNYPATIEVFKTTYGSAANKIGSGSGTVQLPGDNGKALPITFVLSDPATQPESKGSSVLWFKLTVTAPSNRKPQVWYLNANFKTNETCYGSLVYTPSYPSSTTFKRGLSIRATN
ncbi:MAG: beta strand repeat-containing protein [Gemmatimonadales bacterium]